MCMCMGTWVHCVGVHVEEILSRSFGICEVSDPPAVQTLEVSVCMCMGMWVHCVGEEGGYYEGFIHVEEILSRSFCVCDVSDCI